ncbi:MAG TPA: methionine--tRNA ligase, partial [Solirubrobacterales bacterium]|nr:methionine--tRNA ligase [Solirubrobacterales bacterium]
MIDRYREGRLPDADPDPGLSRGDDGLGGVEGRVCELLDRTELTQALEEIWSRVRRLNRYVEETRPWELAKVAGEEWEAGEERQSEARLDQVLYSLAEGLRTVTQLLYPYMPEAADRLLAAIAEPERSVTSFGSRGGGQQIERLPPLFPKIEVAA